METNKNNPKQFKLNLTFPNENTAPQSVQDKVNYNKILAQDATFKGGLKSIVHRWFRLTPSFGPDLVQVMLDNLKHGDDSAVLDPFSGAGTTSIECQLNQIISYGFEINPVLHFVGSTCLNWKLDHNRLAQIKNKILTQLQQDKIVVNYDTMEEKGFEIPPIHNPTRWWRTDVLTDLILLKNAIKQMVDDIATRNFFELGLAGVLVPDLTNVTLGRLQLHFIDRSNDEIDVETAYSEHVDMMLEDLQYIQENGLNIGSQIYLADSTAPRLTNINIEHPIRTVITSPPYPNRYSYVWNTRPHLYLLDFFKNARQASELDKKTIGGTWGTATSILKKDVIQPKYQIINDVVEPIVTQIRQEDNLMANYLMKYFNLLADQIVAMDQYVEHDVKIAYVVGCSRLKGIFVETDVLLGKIIEGLELGYNISAIDRIRKRNSGKNLHESIVYAERN